jgi:RNA polymerase sigma-70 factor (ECF subfamily)
LREINQLSYEEIAAVTGLKLGTVRSRINRARNYFRRIIEPVLDIGVDF